jgi:membrane protease YdiL (CAAX protease family)
VTLRAVFQADDGRLRAGWRILAFVGISLGLFMLTSLMLEPALAGAARLTGIEQASDAIAMTIALVSAHAIMIKGVDRGSWSYAWLDRGAANGRLVGSGLAMGAVPIALASSLLLALGWLAVEPGSAGSWTASAVKLSVVLAIAALYEELFSRGYLLAAIADLVGMPAAVAFTSIAFGLLHLGNPGAKALPIILVCVAGVFLAAVLLATRSLYAAWAAHFAWNWVMAVPMHVSVSGTVVLQPRYQMVESGPDWATGGSWGPEGGAFAGAAMLAGIAYLYVRHKNASNIKLQTSNAVQ